MPDESPLAAAFVGACEDELAALKPGNVHRFADGHGMTVADFEASARAAAPGITRRHAHVGQRILDATEATQVACGCNTNLGIVLLCAPLAAAAERLADCAVSIAADTLSAATRDVLSDLDIDDAALAYRAIALANPGGLGKVEHEDVHQPPKASLLEAMALAAGRDRIAAEYAQGYREIFDFALPLLHHRLAHDAPTQATTVLFLALLARAPDSHLMRKFGDTVAQTVSRDAAGFLRQIEKQSHTELHDALLLWDRALKQRGWNPGTCADLTVATLFAHRLCEASTLPAL
jgi:triphosphoribosyl-dephospho-CoA synthase